MRSSFFLLMGLSLVLLAGCGNRPRTVSQDSVNKLRQGMNFYQVQEILGSPTEDISHGSERSCTWNDPAWMVVVDFSNDKARTIAAIERQRQIPR